ncbi:MAG: ABC transporter permease [Planctomycetota bacterium]
MFSDFGWLCLDIVRALGTGAWPKAWAALWGSYLFHNVLVTGIVLFSLYLAWHSWRSAWWREVWGRVFSKRLTAVCFGILILYVMVGFLDSFAWPDVMRDETGRSRRDKAERLIRERVWSSLLDRVLSSLRNNTEKTYSAPFADVSLMKETVERDGKAVRESPSLAHPGTHILGTDKVGQDVLYRAIKGVRTALIIGAFTTLLAIPFAIFFGVAAGYFRGWADDIIQYLYTTLASIPDILIIASCILIFGRGLAQLAIIMGITSWTGLCRLLRGETMKIRELEYIQSAQALGMSPWRVLLRHIVPNVFHIVIISAVLRFSGLVMSEAMLSFLGIGVDPSAGSWGNMINRARMELAQDPIVWWNLAGAFVFMLVLVLSANIFGDRLRDALDPRLKT